MAERAEVVFVDGVRTPFGRAGEKGQYWNTRADDLIVKAMIGLLERNPKLPKERVDDVAIAATTQTGDQGLTLGRTAAILAGLPLSVPGYAIDRMCAGAMTSVTTIAGAIAFGAYDIGIAGGVEHMGRHPMGAGADPNPRFLAEKLVSPDALNMGNTAERLHDRFPHLTKERSDRFGMLQPAEGRRRVRGRQDPARPDPGRDQERGRLGARHRRRGHAPRDHDGGARDPEDPVPPARQGDRGQRVAAHRRRDRLAASPARMPPRSSA